MQTLERRIAALEARLGQDSSDPQILVTLTAGGNDLLDALVARQPLDAAVDRIRRRYTELVATLREELPRATLLLTTVYDPTDGTGRLPGFEWLGQLPLQYLERFNAHVRETAGQSSGAALARTVPRARAAAETSMGHLGFRCIVRPGLLPGAGR